MNHCRLHYIIVYKTVSLFVTQNNVWYLFEVFKFITGLHVIITGLHYQVTQFCSELVIHYSTVVKKIKNY